jgi:hypothetical protein
VFRVDDSPYMTRLSYSRLAHWLATPPPRPQAEPAYLDFARQAATHPPCPLYERGPAQHD